MSRYSSRLRAPFAVPYGPCSAAPARLRSLVDGEEVLLRTAGGSDIGEGPAQHRRPAPLARADEVVGRRQFHTKSLTHATGAMLIARNWCSRRIVQTDDDRRVVRNAAGLRHYGSRIVGMKWSSGGHFAHATESGDL